MGVAALAGFAQGLAGGLEAKRARDQAAADRAEREADRAAAREQEDDRAVDPSLASSAKDVGIGYSLASRPVAKLAPEKLAFLDAVAGGESGGRFDVRWGGDAGPQTFRDFSKHPGIFAPGPEGPSSAAGRYGFTKTTWDGMGGGAFTPARQDTRAWDLATQRYAATTGRDLDADLRARGLTPEIMRPLSPTWTSLRNAHGRAIATYQASLARYGGAPADDTWAALRAPAA